MEGAATLRASPSQCDVQAVAAAVDAAEARLAAMALGAGAPACDGDGAEAEQPTLRVRAHSIGWSANLARRCAPDPSAASLLMATPFSTGGFSISGAEHENDRAEVCIVCEPDLHNNLMGALHPAGSLYERPVNIKECTRQHAAFRAALRAHGVRCVTVREVMLFNVDTCVRARCALEDLAASRLRYVLENACEERLDSPADAFFVGEEYKRSVLEAMSAEQLADVALCGPTVHVMPSFRDTGFTARYAFDPLTNVQYTRDTAVTTARGVVLTRLRSPQRQFEVELLSFCFQKLGLPVVGAIKAPGFLEGGDFFMAGRVAFVGVGMRSNAEAAQQLMDGDLVGTRYVALVRDDFERDQGRMHLDCMFNIVGDDICLLAADVVGEASPLRRTVDEYERVADADAGATPGQRYVLRRSGVEFSQYLRDAGFNLVLVGREHSMQYGCNVLNLGDSVVLASHAETARQLVRCPAFHGRVQVVDFADVTAMYGGLHCSSQVVRRTPAAQPTAPLAAKPPTASPAAKPAASLASPRARATPVVKLRALALR